MPITARQFATRQTRPAFTLVELLVVMGVLAMLSSLVLVGLSSAAEQARANRTRSQVQKIHELLMPRWDEYRYRRVEASKSGDVRTRQASRVDKIREMMRIEMPDRMSDVIDAPVSLSSVPSLQLRYQRAVTNATGAANFTAAQSIWTSDHESSECLYMILASIQNGETNGLDFFKQSEIGDTDGDGVPEVLDGWGQPILFIRWPFGFPEIATSTTGERRNALSQMTDNSSPDPFDPLGVRGGRTQTAGTGIYDHFPLYPLIFSAGPNGIYNIQVDIGLDYSATTPPNNPYMEVAGTPPQRVGQVADDSGDELDNITNHVLVIAGNSQ
ncbi:prepilin-type N-terminal cleavage/methylation domain-containing protein [Bremerella sp. JC770]|uniref:type II secretion system protein n=1 Tax=Bremerella sp. JC770 TaxID=3232137 RepID=UPI00345775B5